MARERQTASFRRRKASEASQATGQKSKRAGGRPALPRLQPPRVEDDEEEVEEQAEEGQFEEEEVHLAAASSKAWIHEHFPTLQQPQNPNYSEELPRAHRWLPRREASNVSISHYRRMLDDLRADQVIFDPYKDRQGDVRPIVFYTGPIRGVSVVEPYFLDRVLWQFGLVQIIPGDPIAPAQVERGDKKYNVVYTWTDANWTSWEYHVVPEAKRVRTRADVSWECHPDYAEWLSRYSHFRVSPDAGAGEVNIDGSATDGLKLAAITQEVDKVFTEGLSPYNMCKALRHISSILRPTIRGEPRTPRTTEGVTYGRRTDAT